MARGKRIPIVVCVDAEPDTRVVDREAAAPWSGFEALVERLPDARERAQEVAGGPVPLTWFARLDPQVELTYGDPGWPLRHYARAWEEVAATGDEVGIHVHAWRWDEEADTWIADHGDAAWVEHCVEVSLNAYRDFFGRLPSAYRGGDRFVTDAVLRQVEDAGARVDCTVEPGMAAVAGLAPGELTTGSIPDYTGVPERAYRPSRRDFREADPAHDDGLIVLPLTSAGGPDGRKTLVPWTEPAEFATRLTERLREEPVSHLAFAIRSDLPLLPEWDWFTANLATLAGLVAAGGFEFDAADRAATRVRAPGRPSRWRRGRR